MSWNEINDISDLDLLTLGHKKLDVSWLCPRCQCHQITNINIDGLIDGVELSCQNVKVCGEKQSYFELGLQLLSSSVKGLDDRPLCVNGL